MSRPGGMLATFDVDPGPRRDRDPGETFLHAPYAPTLEGQYIIKNIVLICAGLVLGATVRGGRMVADPTARESSDVWT